MKGRFRDGPCEGIVVEANDNHQPKIIIVPVTAPGDSGGIAYARYVLVQLDYHPNSVRQYVYQPPEFD